MGLATAAGPKTRTLVQDPDAGCQGLLEPVGLLEEGSGGPRTQEVQGNGEDNGPEIMHCPQNDGSGNRSDNGSGNCKKFGRIMDQEIDQTIDQKFGNKVC